MAAGADRNHTYTAHLRKCHACAEQERALDEHARGPGADTRGLQVWTSRD